MLFKTITDVKDHSECGAVTFASLKKSIRLAEAQFIKPLLGEALYTVLNDAYAAAPGTPLTEQLTDLLYAVQEALAPLTLYIYIPKAEVQLSDSGAMRNETATSKTAYQNQIKNQREALLAEGIAMQEELLSFLETNKADYSEWTSSPEFKQYRSLFIKTANDFQLQYASASPYRNYYFMRSFMLTVEEQIIKKAIGASLYGDLKTKDAATTPTFTEEEKELLRLLKKSIAHYTIAKAAPRLAIKIDDSGITVMNTSNAQNDELGKKSAATDSQLSLIIRSEETDGNAWLTDALQYIQDKASESVFAPWYTEQQQIAAAAAALADGEVAETTTSVNDGILGSFTI